MELDPEKVCQINHDTILIINMPAVHPNICCCFHEDYPNYMNQSQSSSLSVSHQILDMKRHGVHVKQRHNAGSLSLGELDSKHSGWHCSCCFKADFTFRTTGYQHCCGFFSCQSTQSALVVSTLHLIFTVFN